jgi:hypothetical protein
MPVVEPWSQIVPDASAAAPAAAAAAALMQMAGRAGRRGLDAVGMVVIAAWEEPPGESRMCMLIYVLRKCVVCMLCQCSDDALC